MLEVIVGDVLRMVRPRASLVIEFADGKIAAFSKGGSAGAYVGTNLAFVISEVAVFSQDQSHLLSIQYPFILIQNGHVLFEFLHSPVDVSLVEVVLDGAQHVGDAIKFAYAFIDLILKLSHHILDRAALTSFLHHSSLCLPKNISFLEHAVSHFYC